MVLGKNVLTEIRLQGGKLKPVFIIAFDHKLHRAIAKITNAIE